MNGFQDLASQQQQRMWIYTGMSGSTAFQTWNKPPGISFVQIICVGAGGGGGAGAGYYISPSAGVQIFAPGGGAHGTMTTTLLPAFNVPDTLYIRPGSGGTGGQGGRSGSLAQAIPPTVATAGTPSYVCYYPNTGAGYVLAVATGGGGGPRAQQGNGGSIGGAAAVSTDYPVSQIGLRASINQGTILQSVGITSATYRVVTGGFGRAASITAPGNGAPLGVFPIGQLALQSGSAGTTQGAPGNDGMSDWQKFIFNGGQSGYHSISQNGGEAGVGGYGCGGGGGAYGNPSGSNGGRGGDGFVIITCG